jgi:hypothetical protein
MSYRYLRQPSQQPPLCSEYGASRPMGYDRSDAPPSVRTIVPSPPTPPGPRARRRPACRGASSREGRPDVDQLGVVGAREQDVWGLDVAVHDPLACDEVPDVVRVIPHRHDVAGVGPLVPGQVAAAAPARRGPTRRWALAVGRAAGGSGRASGRRSGPGRSAGIGRAAARAAGSGHRRPRGMGLERVLWCGVADGDLLLPVTTRAFRAGPAGAARSPAP